MFYIFSLLFVSPLRASLTIFYDSRLCLLFFFSSTFKQTTHSHGNFRGGLQNPHKPLQFPVHQSLTETKTAAAAKLPHTSFSPGLGNECHKALDNKDLSLDFACNSLMMPQGWQKSNTDGSYDLAIVGGGIGASYLAYRLQESFSANNEKLPKIALFERTERLGGRLVSEYGPGALGLSVIPRDGAEASSALPLQEYGGMRVDPYRYPLVFNTAVKIGKELSSALDLKCETVEEAGAEAECPLMFVRMNVENVRFSTTSKDLGPLLANATYNTVTTNEYCPQDIKTGSGSPFDKCIQLVVSTTLRVYFFCFHLFTCHFQFLPHHLLTKLFVIQFDSSLSKGCCKRILRRKRYRVHLLQRWHGGSLWWM